MDRRHLLVESLADLDDIFAQSYLEGECELTNADIFSAIRRNTIASKVVPVLMGSSFKNKVRVLVYYLEKSMSAEDNLYIMYSLCDN